MTEAKISLKRREYDTPNILTAVAQVLLEWSPEVMLAFCESIREDAVATFREVTDLRVRAFRIAFGAAVANALDQDNEPLNDELAGLLITLDELGSQMIVDASGYRVSLVGTYRGRNYLFDQIGWVTERARRFDPALKAIRVSVLYSCNVSPPTDRPIYQIEDYFVPVFNIDESLNLFTEFQHTVALGLGALIDGPYRAIVRLGTDKTHGGIALTVDALDEGQSGLDDVAQRLEVVKNLESHVFECMITDKTRKLYGVRNT